jgi:hypothetical protein
MKEKNENCALFPFVDAVGTGDEGEAGLWRCAALAKGTTKG